MINAAAWELRASRAVLPTALATCALALVVACGPPSPAATPVQTARRSFAAVVRVANVTEDGSLTGGSSGTVIDPRGYVLTAFHTVGYLRPEGGGCMPGQWVSQCDGTHVEIGVMTSTRSSAELLYRAQPVLGDALLDLALLRVTERLDGAPLDPQELTVAPLRPPSLPLELGDPIVVAGFIGSFKTMQISAGLVSGLTPNAEGEIAWIRTDALLEPGNSGGAVFDGDGRLAAVPCGYHILDPYLPAVGMALPIDRVPAAWLELMARGEQGDGSVVGVDALQPNVPLTVSMSGDSTYSAESEVRYFRLVPGLGGVVRSTPPDLYMAVVDNDNRVVRSGDGEVEILPDELPTASLAVAGEGTREETATWTVAFEPGAHAQSPLPTATLVLEFHPKSAAEGDFAVGPAGEPVFEWLSHLVRLRPRSGGCPDRPHPVKS